MVQNKAVEWDLVDAESQMMLRLGAQDMLERADFSIISKTDLMAVSEWGIGSVSYGYVLSWSTKAYPQKEPSTWKDFFDATAFPGRRAMYAQPMPNLEFALLSDGVPLDKLYPLDVDRAFRVLERHKPLINVWYKSTTQIPTLFRGEEVDLIEATGGRVIDLKRSGAPVNFTYNRARGCSPSGSPPRGEEQGERYEADGILRATGERGASCPDVRERGAQHQSVCTMPVETGRAPPDVPENIGKQIRIDAAWWSKNVDEITKRWLGFVG
jgi:putative spermidine/putrescine transport system substrate-binding protein